MLALMQDAGQATQLSKSQAGYISSACLPCPACNARILPSDDHVDTFHADCYLRWIAKLYAELHGKIATVRTRAAGGAM